MIQLAFYAAKTRDLCHEVLLLVDVMAYDCLAQIIYIGYKD